MNCLIRTAAGSKKPRYPPEQDRGARNMSNANVDENQQSSQSARNEDEHSSTPAAVAALSDVTLSRKSETNDENCQLSTSGNDFSSHLKNNNSRSNVFS